MRHRAESIPESHGEHHSSGPLLLTAEELARLLGVSVRTLWRLRSAGRLPLAVRLGGSVRWRAAEIDIWVEAGCPSLAEWEGKREALSDSPEPSTRYLKGQCKEAGEPQPNASMDDPRSKRTPPTVATSCREDRQ